MKVLRLIDIDGVLADDRHREHFSIAKRYFEYFNEERMAADEVWPEGKALVETLLANHPDDDLAYLTGRRQDRRQVTEDWLDAAGFPISRLVMRRFDQTAPLALFKRDYMQKMLDSGNWDLVVLYDDDPEVIRVVQEDIGPESGIHCTWHIKPPKMVKLARA